MRYAKIRGMDISNGPGLGVSVFSAGCPFRCKGCHNKELWPFGSGEEWTQEQEDAVLELIQKPHISRLSSLGGEPLIGPNLDALLSLFKKVREHRPDIKIWLYTGYTLDELYQELEKYNYCSPLLRILNSIDYLVDGRFEEDKKDITLAFRGSSNQKIWLRAGINPHTYFPTFKDVTAEFDNVS